MGIPSISIYVNELITEYGVKNLVSVGSCGSMQKDIKLRDVILAMSASTDSNINKLRFKGMDFAPTANFDLLDKVHKAANKENIPVRVGNVLSADTFYNDNHEEWKLWSKFGVLAVEMEAAGLYTLASKYNVNALAVLTVSDSLVTQEVTTAEERQNTFSDMIKITLEGIL